MDYLLAGFQKDSVADISSYLKLRGK